MYEQAGVVGKSGMRIEDEKYLKVGLDVGVSFGLVSK